MFFAVEPTIEEKINQLDKLLARHHELISLSEGSNIILLVVTPEQESMTWHMLFEKYPNSGVISCSSVFLQAVREYGLENLRSDFEFSTSGFLNYISRFIF